MGFVWLGILAVSALALLWVLKLRGSLLTLAAAALAFGCAGYAMQARPELDGTPRQSARRAPPMPVTGARHALMGQFDYSDVWLNMADALASRGNTKDAVNLLSTQVARRPNDYKMWVGLGNALFDHSRTLSPAARYAYSRAAQLAPGYPAPPFFLGLAEARSGNPAEAERLWREVLASAPANASWRPMVEDGLLLIESSSPSSLGEGDRSKSGGGAS
jgi:cytochrome c-type biogenesis protein CcmH